VAHLPEAGTGPGPGQGQGHVAVVIEGGQGVVPAADHTAAVAAGATVAAEAEAETDAAVLGPSHDPAAQQIALQMVTSRKM